MEYHVVTVSTYDPETALEKIDYKMPSCTVPDESYTIEELILRHRAGLLTDVKTPMFMEEDEDEDVSLDSPDLEKFSHLDPVDQMELAEMARTVVPHEKVILKDDEELMYDAKGNPKIVKTKGYVDPTPPTS